MTPILKQFLCILIAALASAALGGLFGAGVAALSPEFARSLFGPHQPVWRFAAGVGMVWGLFIGVSAVSHWVRPACPDCPQE